MADRLAWEFAFPSIGEGTLALDAFKGRVLLVANTASFCGYTNQYTGLEKLHESMEARGLTVKGGCCDDCGPGSCSTGKGLRNDG